MTNPFTPAPQVAGTTGVDGTNKDKIVQVGALQVGSQVLTEAEFVALDAIEDTTYLDQTINETSIGAVAQPTSGSVAVSELQRFGKFFALTLALTAARIPVVDAAGSGSYGTLKLFDFVQGSIAYLGSRQNYTAFAQNDDVVFTGDTTDTEFTVTNISSTTGLLVGGSITGTGIGAGAKIVSIDSATQITLDVANDATGAEVEFTQTGLSNGALGGDAVFEIGIGTAAIAAAANGVLAATNEDVGNDVDVTLSAGTGAGTVHTNSSAVTDGTGTAKDVNLNWSGTAATVDADGYVDVTGTITIVGVFMGDD